MFDDLSTNDLDNAADLDELADDQDFIAWCEERDAEDRADLDLMLDKMAEDFGPDDEDNDWMARPI